MERVYSVDDLRTNNLLGFIDLSITSEYVHPFPLEWRSGVPVEMIELLDQALELNHFIVSSEMGKEPIVSDEADLENTIENLLRLLSIHKSLNGNYAIRRSHLEKSIYSVYLDGVRVGSLDEEASREIKYLFGPKTTQDFRHEKDNTWYKSEALSRYTGRKIKVAGCIPDDTSHPDVYDAIEEYLSSGIDTVFVKMIQTKAMAKRINIKEFSRENGMDPYDIYMMNLEGRSEVYMVQEWIPMRYEYRFMVVNNKIVSGAGSIEDFTPFNRNEDTLIGVLDPMVISKRGSKEDHPVSRPDIVEQLHDEALKLICDYDNESKDRLGDQWNGLYGTVDMAMTLGTDRSYSAPVLVEINGLPNAGFFANSVDQVTQEIVACAENGIYDLQTNSDFKLVDSLKAEMVNRFKHLSDDTPLEHDNSDLSIDYEDEDEDEELEEDGK